MGIFSRTRDIIAANFNDLLEQADDPSKMIRMIIMEREETLVEVRASAARTIADGTKPTLADEISALESSDKVDEELEEMKRALGMSDEKKED